MKEIQIRVAHDEFAEVYLSLFYHSLGLTHTEQRVLEKIVESYLELREKVEEPYLTELVLSTDRRKEISKELKISSADLNNRIKSLRKKDVFLSIDTLVIDPRLVPSKEIKFVFELNEVELKKSKNEQKKSTK